MLYIVNSVFFAWIASFWSKEGWPNILLALAFVLIALANVVAGSPIVRAYLGL